MFYECCVGDLIYTLNTIVESQISNKINIAWDSQKKYQFEFRQIRRSNFKTRRKDEKDSKDLTLSIKNRFLPATESNRKSAYSPKIVSTQSISLIPVPTKDLHTHRYARKKTVLAWSDSVGFQGWFQGLDPLDRISIPPSYGKQSEIRLQSLNSIYTVYIFDPSPKKEPPHT